MKKFPQPNIPESLPVTHEDVAFVMKDTLHPHHHEDPRVIGFINSYVMYRDVRQASRDAGISPQTGHALRRRKDIHNCITKITEMSVLKYGLDPDEIVEKVKEVVNFDPAELVDENGVAYQNMRDIPPDVRRAIRKFEVKNLYATDPNGMKYLEGHLVKVEFWDKMKAAEFLGREKGLFKETRKVEHDVTSNMKDILLESAERGRERRLAAQSETIDVTPKTGMPRVEDFK